MPARPIRYLVILADVIAVPLALFLAYLFRYGDKIGSHLAQPTPWATIILVLVGALAVWLGLYQPMSLDSLRGGWSLPDAASRTAIATVIQAVVVLALAYLAQVYFSRLILIFFVTTFWALVLLIRLTAYSVLRTYHRQGRNRRVVIVGEGQVARELVRRIRRHPEILYEVVGLLNPWAAPGLGQGRHSGGDRSEMGSFEMLKLLEQKGVQEVIVCLEHPPILEVQDFLAHCLEKKIRVSLVPQPYALYGSHPRLVELEGIPLVALERPSYFRVATAFKRTTDLIFSLPLMLLALPVLGIAVLGLKVEGRSPLRRELRGGRLGKPFRMYRLNVDRHAQDATAFQRWICRLSISELPQLINVLVGEMSLVGPRPETLERIRAYSEWQRQRLNIMPGMTGLAQVNGLREQHSSEEKTRYDLQYVVKWTLVLDFIILLDTLWTLFARLLPSTKSPAPPPSADDQSTELVPHQITE